VRSPSFALPSAAFAAMALLTLAHAAPAAEATAIGDWLIEDATARVRISACGAELCGNVSWIEPGAPTVDVNNPDAARRSRPLLGSAVLLGLKPTSANQWTGSLYNAEDGHTYTGKLTVADDNHVKVAGCVLGGLICKSQTWTRVK
jgi:uncharacterized protein (DUF2147 family)